MSSHGQSKTGFTLIELLVVIAIITVVGGDPGALPARGQAEGRGCGLPGEAPPMGTCLQDVCGRESGEVVSRTIGRAGSLGG